MGFFNLFTCTLLERNLVSVQFNSMWASKAQGMNPVDIYIWLGLFSDSIVAWLTREAQK